jgi:hypothetical protein
MSNAISEHQAAAAQQAADQKLLSTLSPSDPAHQAAFARMAERRHEAEREAAAATKVTAARRYVQQVSAYADSVKAAVRDVAKLKPLGPVLPTQRRMARQLLHNGSPGAIAATPGHLEPTMRELLELQQRGQFLIDNEEPVDPIVLEELSQAEAQAWSALIQRAKLIAGEVGA